MFLQLKRIHRENQVYDNADPEGTNLIFLVDDINEEIEFLQRLLEAQDGQN